MKTQVQELADNRVRLDVEVPAHDVDHAFDHALSDLSHSVRVPGFRKGKAPKGLVMQRVGRQTVIDEALRDHLAGWYTRAVAVAGIDPIERPTIAYEDEPEQGTPFSFSAEVDVKPAPQVRDYKGLEAVRPPAEVPRDAIDRELERLRLSVAELRPAERGARTGDFVVIDFTGTVDGKPFEGGSGSDYGVELGAGRLLPELEAGIEGMSAGESRDVPLRMPDDYGGPEIAGKEIVFRVTVKDVKERVLPAADDELATAVSEFDTLAELEADIQARMHESLSLQADQAFRSAVLAELAGRLSTPVPEPLVKDRMGSLTRDLVAGLRARGLTLDDYLLASGQSSDDVLQALEPQARDGVAKDLALEAVADAEAIQIPDERVEEWVREQARAAEEDEEDAVRRLMGDQVMLTALRTDLRLQKALDVVVEHAKPITSEQAKARERLWTPEKESTTPAANTGAIWTPGSREPAER